MAGNNSSSRLETFRKILYFWFVCTAIGFLLTRPPSLIEQRLQARLVTFNINHNTNIYTSSNASLFEDDTVDIEELEELEELEDMANEDQLDAKPAPSKSSGGRSKRSGGGGSKASGDAESKGNYKNCMIRQGSKPSLEGMPLKLPRNVHLNDSFIHKENHARYLRNEFTLHRHSVPLLPTSHDDAISRLRLKSCAVVGNSGSLKLSRLGDAIDTHDVVVRLNHSPVANFGRWVGTKTHVRVLNTLWTKHYGQGRYKDLNLPLEKGVTLIVTRSTGHGMDKMLETMHKKRPDVRVLQLNSRFVSAARRLLVSYRVKLCSNGFGPYVGGNTPSSGYVAVFLMLKLCKRVTLYGMGKVESFTRPVPYHYFTGIGSRTEGNPVHSFDTENFLFSAMAHSNVVELCKYRIGKERRWRNATVSNLRKTVPELENARDNNHFCGWNMCNRRELGEIKRNLKSARGISPANCGNVMFNSDPEE